MIEVTVRDLMQAGAHFGHQTKRWDPKMRPYIFTSRGGVHIIDLDQTLIALKQAYNFITEVVANGNQVLFVGTKRQAQDIILEQCQQIDMPYVVYRWLGGTLTNFFTIRGSIHRLEELEAILADENKQRDYVKKELVKMGKEAAKLSKNLKGILEMKRLPGAMFVIDPNTERIAVAEAKRLHIPVVAVVDTNCNPDPIDFTIPANDDALKSIELFTRSMADACRQGRILFEERVQAEAQQEKEAQAEPQESGDVPAGKNGAAIEENKQAMPLSSE